MKAQVYKDPRPAEHFARFHERSRTREPDWVYEVVRVLTSLYVVDRSSAPAASPPRRCRRSGPVILAPNHFSFMDHFFLGVSIAAQGAVHGQVAALHSAPMQWVYTHGGVFPVRRGYRDEEAFITAHSDPRARRHGRHVLRGRPLADRASSASGRKPGIGRLALESGATGRAGGDPRLLAACATGSGCSSRRSRSSTASRSASSGSPSRRASSSRRVADEIFDGDQGRSTPSSRRTAAPASSPASRAERRAARQAKRAATA